MSDSLTIHIDGAGRMRFVFDDSARDLLSLGLATINRASHVEPAIDPTTGDCLWTADLAPIGGPVLGPFASREQALTAEIDEIERRLSDSALISSRSWLLLPRGI